MGEDNKPITAAYVVELEQNGAPKYKPLPGITVSSLDTLGPCVDGAEIERRFTKMVREDWNFTIKLPPQDAAVWRWALSGSDSRVLPARLRRMHAAKLQRIRKQIKRRKKEEHHGRN